MEEGRAGLGVISMPAFVNDPDVQLVLWAVINAFRDYNYTSEHGYVSFGGWTVLR